LFPLDRKKKRANLHNTIQNTWGTITEPTTKTSTLRITFHIAQITPKPQGVTVTTPQSEQSTLFDLWDVSLADRQVSTIRLGFFCHFLPHRQDHKSYAPPVLATHWSSPKIRAHNIIDALVYCTTGEFCLFSTPPPRPACLLCWRPIGQAQRHESMSLDASVPTIFLDC